MPKLRQERVAVKSKGRNGNGGGSSASWPLRIVWISGFFVAIIGYVIFHLNYTSSMIERLSIEDSMDKPQQQQLMVLGDYKIIGVVSNPYKAVAAKWFERLEDLGYREHVIISYDNRTSQYLEELNQNQQHNKYHYRYENYFLPPFPLEKFIGLGRGKRYRKRTERVFSMRWHYILSQLKNGTSILLTDVDNIFNKYLNLEKNSDFSTFDVIHAYSNSIPLHVIKQMGFTVCGGMSWLKATPPTIDFVQRLVDKCGTICDDQIVLNEMIANEMAIEWDRDTTNFTSNTQSRIGRSNTTGHTVKIWDHYLAYRGPSLIADGCPLDNIETNWIAMPMSDGSLVRGPLTRGKSPLLKLRMFDAWDKMCGINVTRNTVVVSN